MQMVGKLEYKTGTREEALPGFDPAFPCITTRYEIPQGNAAPWHWHPAAELFYIEQGSVEYITPDQRRVFPEGSGGILMPNVPHMTFGSGGLELLHLFEPMLISGQAGSRIEEKYVLPMTTGKDLIALDPENHRHSLILDRIRDSFLLNPMDPGYELLLRDALSRIWIGLLTLEPGQTATVSQRTSELIRQMMIYVHEHYGEKLTVEELSASVHISQRMCYKLFQKHLHISPMEYVNSCRVRAACQMLSHTEEPISAVAAACGFRTGSYFTQVFQEATGLTPRDYRRTAQQEEIL